MSDMNRDDQNEDETCFMRIHSICAKTKYFSGRKRLGEYLNSKPLGSAGCPSVEGTKAAGTQSDEGTRAVGGRSEGRLVRQSRGEGGRLLPGCRKGCPMSCSFSHNFPKLHLSGQHPSADTLGPQFFTFSVKVNGEFVLRACLSSCVSCAVAGAVLAVVGALWSARLLLSSSS